ncbi:hypothetical protein GQX74_007991 [Glossina fuscipes]|nr:hypothetical protein GQX74_007991 [Glossina fuscipes]
MFKKKEQKHVIERIIYSIVKLAYSLQQAINCWSKYVYEYIPGIDSFHWMHFLTCDATATFPVIAEVLLTVPLILPGGSIVKIESKIYYWRSLGIMKSWWPSDDSESYRHNIYV